MEPRNGFTNPLPCSFLSAHCVFFWLLLALAIGLAVWLLVGIVRAVRSNEFRRDVDELGARPRGKKWWQLLLLLVLLSPPAPAQEPKPTFRVPHYNRKALIAEASLLAASKTADAITTGQLLDRGGHENNPIFGPHPSPARQSLINLGIFAAETGALYLAERNRHAWVRWTGRAFLTHVIVEHSRLAACNAGIDTRSPRVQNCEPFLPL